MNYRCGLLAWVLCMAICLSVYIQKAMYASLRLAGEPSVQTSSRTDRGVHALCSSVHADLQHESVSHLSILPFIYLLCKSYQGTRKIMQNKAQKRKKTYKKHFKKQKNTSHGAYIVHSRLYI